MTQSLDQSASSQRLRLVVLPYRHDQADALRSASAQGQGDHCAWSNNKFKLHQQNYGFNRDFTRKYHWFLTSKHGAWWLVGSSPADSWSFSCERWGKVTAGVDGMVSLSIKERVIFQPNTYFLTCSTVPPKHISPTKGNTTFLKWHWNWCAHIYVCRCQWLLYSKLNPTQNARIITYSLPLRQQVHIPVLAQATWQKWSHCSTCHRHQKNSRGETTGSTFTCTLFCLIHLYSSR